LACNSVVLEQHPALCTDLQYFIASS